MADQFNQYPSSGRGPDASLAERATTREERIRQQHAMQEQQRQRSRPRTSRPISAGGRAMEGFSSGRSASFVPKPPPSRASDGGFVPKPPPGRAADGEKRPASSRGGGAGAATSSVSPPVTSPSHDYGRSEGVTSPADDNLSLNDTGRKLALLKVRGDVDFSEKGVAAQQVPQIASDDDDFVSEEDLPAAKSNGRSQAQRPSVDTDETSLTSSEGVASPGARSSVAGSGGQLMGSAAAAASPEGSEEEQLVNPQRSPNQSPVAIRHVETGQVADFVDTPVPSEETWRCRFTRSKGTFYLHLELPDCNKKFLLAARKRQNARSKDFLISLDSTDISRESAGYLGKLQCNLTGTEFTLYNNGANPSKSRALPDHSNAREELVAVHYGKAIFGLGGPRKMTVILPHLNQQNERLRICPKTETDTLVAGFKNNRLPPTSVVLENKTAAWSAESESYVLNFNGRVTKASVKNFQIVHPDDKDYIVMQFGRVGEDQFTLDFSYPLCPTQAFAIALSSCFKNFTQ